MRAHEATEAERAAEAQRRALAPTITLEQQIACIRRELAMRQRVYPKWVEGGRMKQAEADHQLAAMQAAHDTLTQVQAERNPVLL